MADTSISGIEFQIKGATGKAASSVDKLTSSLRSLKGALQTGSTGKLKKDMDDIDKSAKKADTTLGKLAKSIGRIAFYRAIRAAIKFVTDGFKEGLENAYQFSKVVGYELAGTMDRLATKSLTMKNQLGSAFGGLIMAAEPVLLQLIGLVTRAANALAQLMAIIGGRTTYLKAIDTVTEYGEAIGGAGQAAKEAMKYLAPFDELNRLPGDNGSSSGGGGSHTPDYSAMFEETPVAQALQDFVTDFKISVSDVLFDWTDLTGEQIAEKVLAGLFMLTGAGVGFILGGVPGALIGSILGLTLGLVADTFVFDHDGALEPNEIAHGLQYALNALAGGVIGFVAGGPGGAIIGASIGLGISLLADSVQLLPGEGRINRDVLLDQLTVALGMLTGAVLGFTVGGPAGALIGAVVGLGITATITAIKFNNSEGALAGESGRTGLDYFIVDVLGLPSDDQWREWGSGIWQKISVGVSEGWHWLADGWKDFKTELYNIFIKPIVDVWDEFISNHPKIAKILGLSQSGGNIFQNNGETFKFNIEGQAAASELNSSGREMVINATANVTGMKDDIPTGKKILGDVAAKITSLNDVVPIGKKIVNGVKAAFNSTQDKTTQAQKTLSATAKFTSSKDSLTSSQKTVSVLGRITSALSALTSKPSLDSRGLITTASSVLTSRPALDSLGRITDAYDSMWDWPVIDSEGMITSAYDAMRYSPDVESDGKITYAYDAIPYYATPEVGCIGVITGISDAGQPYSISYGKFSKGGAFYGGSWHDIPQAASGGKFHGTMFWAGENGPEVVGHAGGRSEVLNRSQLASTMYAAVSSALSGIQMRVTGMGTAPMTGAGDDGMSEDVLYRAMLRALNDSDVFPDEIDLDGDVVYRKIVQRNRQEKRRMGVNPMMA